MLKILKSKVFVKTGIFSIYLIFTSVLLPYIITEVFFNDYNTVVLQNYYINQKEKDDTEDLNSFTEEKNMGDLLIKEENPQMESYIIGVVAAEMPVSFHKEALKAQAVAARTYAYRQVGNGEINPENIGQAFITVDEMKKNWGSNFESNFKKVSDAVNKTKNEIMVYRGEPILAAFHSTSGGMTENSENVWSEKLDYLKSVDSHGDENAPGFLNICRFPKNEFIKKFSENGAIFSENIQNDISELKRTEAGYVSSIKIGGKVFKGSDVRKILSLKSANFDILYENDEIVFKTKGYGHGAGMSQYGANFMALDGDDYKKILSHYYYGVEFISIKG